MGEVDESAVLLGAKGCVVVDCACLGEDDGSCQSTGCCGCKPRPAPPRSCPMSPVGARDILGGCCFSGSAVAAAFACACILRCCAARAAALALTRATAAL